MQEPTIRRATTHDIAMLHPLIEAYWKFEGIAGFDPPRIHALVHRLLSDPKLGAGWIALRGEVAIGYLLGVYVFSLEHLGLTAEIDELFIDQSARARGLGSELLRVAEAEFRAAGCTQAFLQIGQGNESARKFYLAHGYAPRVGYDLLDKTW